jgi:formylglycine-generating enzyme required for sulfatase activity
MGMPQSNAAAEVRPLRPRPDNMVWIPGGDFRMPRDRGIDEAGRTRRAFVTGFWMDRAPVTVRQFGEFVAATDYADGFAVLVRPFDDRPAVHVTYRDAEAYSAWAHKALPTEAEWEFAAQGSYELCGMTSGIWEWTADWYWPRAGGQSPNACCASDLPGDEARANPPNLLVPRKVLKGGSCLCGRSCTADYAGRTRCQPIDVSAAHIGFRCVAGATGVRARSAYS